MHTNNRGWGGERGGRVAFRILMLRYKTVYTVGSDSMRQ